MKKIYLDFNVFISYLREENTYRILDDLKDKYNFIYSPAYLEEIANITANSNYELNKRYNRHLDKISHLTNNEEFLPTTDTGIKLVNEDPKDCFARVKNKYFLTEIAESVVKDHYELLIEYINDFREQHDLNSKVLNNINPEEIFYDPRIKKALFYLTDDNFYKRIYNENSKIWDEIKSDYQIIESILEELFNLLETLNYCPDKERHRSRMHDISHAIYGTAADFFVCDDKFFLNKCKAVYNLLGVPTEVLNYKEFLDEKVNLK